MKMCFSFLKQVIVPIGFRKDLLVQVPYLHDSSNLKVSTMNP
jgi:hypothetical protein